MRAFKITTRKIAVLLASLSIMTALFVAVPKPAEAISYNFIAKIIRVYKAFKKYYDYYKKYSKGYDTYNKYGSNIPRVFPFGGHITHAEGGCHIKYWVFIYSAPPFGQPLTFPGVPIPLGGDTIEVGPPLKSPEGQLFTFPYVSQIYANNNQDTEGVWALGIAFSPFPIDEINDVLGEIPHIPIPDGYLYDFHLDCSKDNKNVILQLGTSGT
jgi:hypothetical protein